MKMLAMLAAIALAAPAASPRIGDVGTPIARLTTGLLAGKTYRTVGCGIRFEARNYSRRKGGPAVATAFFVGAREAIVYLYDARYGAVGIYAAGPGGLITYAWRSGQRLDPVRICAAANPAGSARP